MILDHLQSSFSQIKRKSFLLTVFLLLLSTMLIFFIAENRINKQLFPELEKKAITVGRTVTSPIEKAISYKIPVEKLKGLDEHFSDALEHNKEFKYIILTDTKHNIIHAQGLHNASVTSAIQSGGLSNLENSEAYKANVIENFQNTAMPVIVNDKVEAYIHLGTDVNVIKQHMREISYDVLIVLIISLVVTIEILIFSLFYKINNPLNLLMDYLQQLQRGIFDKLTPVNDTDIISKIKLSLNQHIQIINHTYHQIKNKITTQSLPLEDLEQIEGSIKKLEKKCRFSGRIFSTNESPIFLNYIRTPLFIFVFAETLSVSFLPLFSNYLYTPIFNIPREIVIALPIIFFMLVYSITQPFSGFWGNFRSTRHIFMIGAIFSTIGLVGSGLSENIITFLLWRMFTAIGYGTILISCQAYIMNNTSEENRNQGMAIFVSGFYSATVCGSAIGSILADGIGYRWTFIVSAFLSLLSALFVYKFIRDQKVTPYEKTTKASIRKAFSILKNTKFTSMVLLVSIPSKILVAAVIYYMTPLFLNQIGTKQSEIGRIIMLYGFIILILSPLAANYADKWKNPLLFITIGSAISGLSCFMIYFYDGVWGLVLTIVLMGIGHGFSLTSQIAIIPSLLKEESEELGKGTVSALYRFLELQGLVIGPLIAGITISYYGFVTSILFFGIIVFLLSVLFSVIVLPFLKRRLVPVI